MNTVANTVELTEAESRSLMAYIVEECDRARPWGEDEAVTTAHQYPIRMGYESSIWFIGNLVDAEILDNLLYEEEDHSMELLSAVEKIRNAMK